MFFPLNVPKPKFSRTSKMPIPISMTANKYLNILCLMVFPPCLYTKSTIKHDIIKHTAECCHLRLKTDIKQLTRYFIPIQSRASVQYIIYEELTRENKRSFKGARLKSKKVKTSTTKRFESILLGNY